MEKVSDTILRIGDVLLVQGPENRLASADRSPELAVLDEVTQPFYDPQKGLITVVMFLAAVIIGTFGGIAIGYPTFSGGLGFHTWFHIKVPLSVAFLGAAVVTVLLRCITAEKAYEMMDWKLLILVGGMTAFGRAMEVDRGCGVSRGSFGPLVFTLWTDGHPRRIYRRDRAPYTAHVECRRCTRRPAGGAADGHTTRRQPA